MDKAIEQPEKKQNRFQWFLFVILIPSLFAIALALIVLTIAGVNVFDKAKDLSEKIPFISSMADEKQPSKSLKSLEKKSISLEAEIKDKEAKIDQLESQLDSKDLEIERSNLEKQQLQAEIDELQAAKNENKRAMKDIVQTYESMSPSKSAPIIAAMKQEEAAKILSNVQADTLAAIMEKMDPKDAARFTEILTNKSQTSASQP